MKIINSILFYCLAAVAAFCIASSNVLSWFFGLMIVIGMYALGKKVGGVQMSELLGVSYLCKKLSSNALIADLMTEE